MFFEDEWYGVEHFNKGSVLHQLMTSLIDAGFATKFGMINLVNGTFES